MPSKLLAEQYARLAIRALSNMCAMEGNVKTWRKSYLEKMLEAVEGKYRLVGKSRKVYVGS